MTVEIGKLAAGPCPPLKWCPVCRTLSNTTEEDRGAHALCPWVWAAGVSP